MQMPSSAVEPSTRPDVEDCLTIWLSWTLRRKAHIDTMSLRIPLTLASRGVQRIMIDPYCTAPVPPPDYK